MLMPKAARKCRLTAIPLSMLAATSSFDGRSYVEIDGRDVTTSALIPFLRSLGALEHAHEDNGHLYLPELLNKWRLLELYPYYVLAAMIDAGMSDDAIRNFHASEVDTQLITKMIE